MTSRVIEHVKLSVFGGSVNLSYGGATSTLPSAIFLLSKNENVTVDVLTAVFGSKLTTGVYMPSTTIAWQERIFPGAVGCEATAPLMVVAVCAPAVRNVAEPTMPATATTAKERRTETSIKRLKELLSYGNLRDTLEITRARRYGDILHKLEPV